MTVTNMNIVLRNESSGFFAPVDASLIGSLLTTYRMTRASVDIVAACMASDDCKTAMRYYLDGCRDMQGRVGLSVDVLMQPDKAIAALNADYWDRALKLTDILECMPQKRRDEWYSSIKEMQTPEFNEDNLVNTMQELLNSREKFFAERVDGIFRALSGEHVTNAPSGFGKRMILYVQTSYGTTHTTNVGHIADLRKIIAKFMGRDEPRGWGATEQVIRAGMGQTGEWLTIDGGALRIRCYQKGTAHLEVHPDMAWRLNGILALLYPAAIPAEFRQKPKRKPKNVELIQKPLPFSVVEELAAATQSWEWVDDLRRRRRYIPNTSTLRYDVDKFIKQQTEAVYLAIGGVPDKTIWRFDYDPTTVLQQIIASGCVPDHKSHQYYPTPSELAEIAVAHADLRDGMTSLEPSAGQGGIADYMHVGKTVCVEVSDLHCKILQEKGHRWIAGDFLSIDMQDKFDRIIMNPPFSDGRWQAHVEHAAGMLADGGVLVAIVPSSANGKFTMPGYLIEWLGVYNDCFAGTSVSVTMMRVTRGE